MTEKAKSGYALKQFRVLITRSTEGNRELAERLVAMGLQPIQIDAISFAPPEAWAGVDRVLGRLANFDWVIFTSRVGVRCFTQRMQELGLPLPKEKPLVATVGSETALELAHSGLTAAFIPSSYLADSLAKELPEGEGRNVLLLQADRADTELRAALITRGFDVEEQHIYRTIITPRQAHEQLSDVDFVIFASPSAVEGLCGMVDANELADLLKKRTFCIGPVTARAAEEKGFVEIVVPGPHSIDGLLDEIQRSVGEL